MGLDVVVARAGTCPLKPLLEKLAAVGLPSSLMMIDNQMVSPRAEPPVDWRDVRLRTPAGMATLARRPGGIAVVVFGNADPALVDAQRKIADAIRDLP